MKISRVLTVAVVSLGLGVATALAKNDEDKHRRGKDKHAQGQAQQPAKKARAKFRSDDRHIVQTFYAQHPGALPPGLAKKGKLPPGHAKRGVHPLAVAQIVTPEIEINLLPLPHALEVQLPPPPHTVIRRILGRDLVMIDKHTNKVLDVLHDALP